MMANEQSQKPDKSRHERLETIALQIFASAMSVGVPPMLINQAARRAFQGANAFMEQSDKYASGTPIQPFIPTGIQMANCSAPNLSKTHPINLVAVKHQRRDHSWAGGDLELVAKIWERIKGIDVADPDIDRRLEDSDLGINWTRDEIVTAKHLFPAYVGKN
jgi:hypothetical protein